MVGSVAIVGIIAMFLAFLTVSPSEDQAPKAPSEVILPITFPPKDQSRLPEIEVDGTVQFYIPGPPVPDRNPKRD